MTQNIITEFKGKFAFLSNFHPSEVELEGDKYPTVEHAYQAAKTADPAERKMVRELKTPGEAKKAGKTVVRRPDFEALKLQYMRFLVWQKFYVHRVLGEKLLLTGDARLVEGNNWGDAYWGVCNGSGENWLGVILEEVREEIKKNKAPDKVFLPGPDRIFVFGSNLSGVHGAGAAAAAFHQYGAQWHKADGLQGQSYGIPTKDKDVKTSLPLPEVAKHVQTFLAFAQANPQLYFFVTRIGCGLAGFKDEDIGPMFKGAPPNCDLPYGWGT